MESAKLRTLRRFAGYVGRVIRGCASDIGQVVARIEWVVWVYKILVLVKKFLAQIKNLEWIGVGSKFHVGW